MKSKIRVFKWPYLGWVVEHPFLGEYEALPKRQKFQDALHLALVISKLGPSAFCGMSIAIQEAQ